MRKIRVLNKNQIKNICRKNTANEEKAPRRFHLGEKRPEEDPKASTSAVVPEQNNASVHQGEKALLEIIKAGFDFLNKSMVSLRQQDDPKSE